MTGTNRLWRLTRLRRLIANRRDERGSMAMLLMVTLVGVMLGGLLIPVIVSQDQSTRFDASRVQSLDAAQAGIDVVVGQIRNSVTSDGTGDDSQLPCGPFTGNAVTQGVASYYTQIIYYTADPIANPNATPMICAAGYGPYDGNQTRSPSYACIISTGVAGGTVSTLTSNTDSTCVGATGSYGTASNSSSKGRTIVTTYVFKTEDNNIAGGVIRVFPDSSGNQYCMDASANPTTKTPVTLQPCSSTNPPAPQQTFAYRSDLSIQLVSSAINGSMGLCLDSNTPHAAGNAIYLDTCSANPYQTICTTKPTTSSCTSTPDQQWSIDDNSHLEGAKSDASDIDGYCVTAASQAAGIPLLLQTCAGGVTDTMQTWVPSPSVGAGMAGGNNNQLVNFKLFGNCLDVTGQDPTSTFLILYTCKQNPDPTNVAWNQKFTPNPSVSMQPSTDTGVAPTAAELVTTQSGTRYCLVSPLTLGGYAVVKSGTSCPSSVPGVGNAARWTIYRLTDSSGNQLPYDSRYVIKDANGFCLGLGNNDDLLNGQYVKAVVTTCDGSTGQKWNAAPSTGKSVLQNTVEAGTTGN